MRLKKSIYFPLFRQVFVFLGKIDRGVVYMAKNQEKELEMWASGR